MIRSLLIKPGLTLLTFLLAVSMVFAPLMPVSAMVAGSDGAHAGHVSHDGDHGVAGSDQADYPSKPCNTHDSCAGQCCAGCAHCFGAVSLFQPAYVHSHPVKTPVLSRLHSLVLIASPDRPPRPFSL